MRGSIGLIAVVLLVGSALLWGRADESLVGGMLRVGVVMGLWWLAHPQLKVIPPWLVGGIFFALLIAMRWPKFLLVAIPALAVMWFLNRKLPVRRRSTVPREPTSRSS